MERLINQRVELTRRADPTLIGVESKRGRRSGLWSMVHFWDLFILNQNKIGLNPFPGKTVLLKGVHAS